MGEIVIGVLRMPSELFWDDNELTRSQHDSIRGEAADMLDRYEQRIAELEAEIYSLQEYPNGSPYISYEDPRYPTLVVPYENETHGYSIRTTDWTLHRVCICAAYSENECCCGAWQALKDSK